MAFHVLAQKSVPNVLFSGHTSSLVKGIHTYTQSDSNSVVCGAPVGQRREAISYERFISYENQGKLRTKTMCKACAKKLGVRKDPNG